MSRAVPSSARRVLIGVAIALVAGAFVNLGACSRKEPEKKAAAGDVNAPRVVALSPAIAAIMRDEGFERLIVGRHAYDIVLPRAIPSCGEQGTLDYEALLATRPSHVLVQWGKQELPARLMELGRQQAWHVESIDILTLEQIDQAQQRVHELLDPARAMDQARLTSARIDALKTANPELGSRGRVLLIASAGATFGVLGPGSCHAQVLERLGMRAAKVDGGPWSTMDAEDIFALRPDGIIVIQPRAWGAPAKAWTDEEALGLLAGAARLDLPAIREKRLAVIDDPLALIPSTSMADFAADVARAVVAWQPVETTAR